MASPVILRRRSLDSHPTSKRVSGRRKSCLEASMTPVLLYNKSPPAGSDDISACVDSFVSFANAWLKLSHKEYTSVYHRAKNSNVSTQDSMDEGTWSKGFAFQASGTSTETSSLLLSPSESIFEPNTPMSDCYSSSEAFNSPRTPDSKTFFTSSSSANSIVEIGKGSVEINQPRAIASSFQDAQDESTERKEADLLQDAKKDADQEAVVFTPRSLFHGREDPDAIHVLEEDDPKPFAIIARREISLLSPPRLLPPRPPPRTFFFPPKPERKPVPAYTLPILPEKFDSSPQLTSSDSRGTFSSDTIDEKELSVLCVEKEKRGFVATCKLWIQTNYYVCDESPEVLVASAPSDEEKLSYVEVHKGVLCSMGMLTLLSSSAGMWMFVICGNIFYWLGAVFIIGQIGFSIFQLSSIMATKFDHKNHLKTLAKHPIPLSKELDCSQVPSIDVYLPCCKEPIDVIENTYKYVQQLSWPASKLQVHVLDDGAQDEVRDLAARYGFNYILRPDRPHLKKAGNLRNAFKNTRGDYFLILDADFCPRHDFLLETVPVMEEEKDIGIIQTPQYFRTSKSMGKQTWVERGAGATQELFYRLIQTCRDSWGGVICAGSCALYRRGALVEIGGTAPLESSEDIFTGFYLALDGYRTKYLPLNLSCGICPDTSRAYFSQQIRWCEGSCSLVLAGEFWKSSLQWKAKLLFFSGLLYYLDQSIIPFIMPMCSILLIWFRVGLLNWYNLAFAIPSILFGYWVCRFWSRAKHAKSVQFVNIIQSYAYASAFIDRILGSSYAWVPSGDAKAHKSNRYRNARCLCIVWTFSTTAALFSGITYQLLKGHTWYFFLPIIALHFFTIHQSIPFIMAK